MTIQRVNNSTWDSSDNLIVENVAEMLALPEERWEGILVLRGYSNVLDGGGGIFNYNESVDRALADGGGIFDPTGTGEGSGCWVRVLESIYMSLAWYGSNDTTTSNLLEEYGYSGLVVTITETDKGGLFQFDPSEVVNHNGVNNFNGWVRVNDPNFVSVIKMNGHRITQGAEALAGTDYVILDQVIELIQTGNYVGIVPQYVDRVLGDNVTQVYITAASEAEPQPQVELVSGAAFEIALDGGKQRHDIDFTINNDSQSPDFGKATFVVAPATGVKVDIVWFAPIIADIFAETAVTADFDGDTDYEGTPDTHQINEWVGKASGDIDVKATGTSAYKKIGDRFADDAIYFDHLVAMEAGYKLFKPGAITAAKGELVAGDGGFGFYFIKTKAQADSDGDDYVTEGTPNILFATPQWVAVWQKPKASEVLSESHTLINGQVEVVFVEDVSTSEGYVSGPDVDTGILKKGTDYTLSADGKTVTLASSYPEGTCLTFNWYSPTDGAGSGAISVYDEGNLVGVPSQLNFVGADVSASRDLANPDQVNIYIPNKDFSGTGETSHSLPAVVGNDLTDVVLDWSYEPHDGVTLDVQTLVGSTIGSIPIAVGDRSKAIAQTISADETFTIHGEDSVYGPTDIIVDLLFASRLFYGRSPNATLDESQVLALSEIEDLTAEQTLEFEEGSGYLYLCYPKSLVENPLGVWKDKYTGMLVVTASSVQELEVNGIDYYVQRTVYPITSLLHINTEFGFIPEPE